MSKVEPVWPGGRPWSLHSRYPCLLNVIKIQLHLNLHLNQSLHRRPQALGAAEPGSGPGLFNCWTTLLYAQEVTPKHVHVPGSLIHPSQPFQGGFSLVSQEATQEWIFSRTSFQGPKNWTSENGSVQISTGVAGLPSKPQFPCWDYNVPLSNQSTRLEG